MTRKEAYDDVVTGFDRIATHITWWRRDRTGQGEDYDDPDMQRAMENTGRAFEALVEAITAEHDVAKRVPRLEGRRLIVFPLANAVPFVPQWMQGADREYVD